MSARGLLPIVLIAILWLAPAHADVTVRATLNPRRAQVGEGLQLTIQIEGAQDVAAPQLDKLDGFDARYVGPSTQVSIINGRMSASVQHRYSLLPMQAGHFTVGPFSVDYDGKHYQTESFGVDITAAGQPAPQAPGQAPAAPAGRAAQQTGQGSAIGGALRLVMSTPRNEVYLHEQLPVDVNLYIGATRVGDIQYPSLAGDGLSVDKFPEPTQQQQKLDNQIFQVLHFQTTVIPLRAGSLALGPATLGLNVYDRRSNGFFGDSFFAQGHPMTVRADPVILNVLPLPEDGKPAPFSGAVGTFTMQVGAAPTELTAGDPITLRMALTGSGNLGDASPPMLASTDGFRTYEPHASKADGGAKQYEQVLIPNDAAIRAIPPVRFSYFDPQARRYQTIESQPIALIVRPPPNAPHAEVVAGGTVSRRAPEEKLGRDIVYIKDDPGRLQSRADTWYRNLPLLLWEPVPLLLFGAAIWFDRRRQRLSGDIRYARFTRAGKQARLGLAAAEQALAHGDRQKFYDAVSRTIQAYLSAKLDLPPGGIDAAAVSRRGVPADCVRQVTDLFATCEGVRFAPGAADGDMRGTLALAQEIIKRLERERRLGTFSSSKSHPSPQASPVAGQS